MVRDPRVSYDADSSLVNDYDNSTGSSGIPSRPAGGSPRRQPGDDPRQSRKHTDWFTAGGDESPRAISSKN